MKRSLLSALALVLLTLALASCAGMGAGETDTTEAGAQSTQSKTEEPKPAYSDALGLLGTIYEKYNASQTSEESRLAVGGGVGHLVAGRQTAPRQLDIGQAGAPRAADLVDLGAKYISALRLIRPI